MADQKLENLLNISLQATKEEQEKSEELGIAYKPQQKKKKQKKKKTA